MALEQGDHIAVTKKFMEILWLLLAISGYVWNVFDENKKSINLAIMLTLNMHERINTLFFIQIPSHEIAFLLAESWSLQICAGWYRQ